MENLLNEFKIIATLQSNNHPFCNILLKWWIYFIIQYKRTRKPNPFSMLLYIHGTAWHHSLENFYMASYMFNSNTIKHSRNMRILFKHRMPALFTMKINYKFLFPWPFISKSQFCFIRRLFHKMHIRKTFARKI